MQNRALFIIAILLFALTGCNKSEPQLVTDAAGKFKLLMPGKAVSQSQPVAGLTAHGQVYEERDGAFMVMYADMPIGDNESEAELQTRLDGGRDGAISNVGGKLLSEARIKLAGQYHGREFRGDVPKAKGILVSRIYIVDKRLYQIVVIGKAYWVDREVIRKCLDSFELLP